MFFFFFFFQFGLYIIKQSQNEITVDAGVHREDIWNIKKKLISIFLDIDLQTII